MSPNQWRCPVAEPTQLAQRMAVSYTHLGLELAGWARRIKCSKKGQFPGLREIRPLFRDSQIAIPAARKKRRDYGFLYSWVLGTSHSLLIGKPRETL